MNEPTSFDRIRHALIDFFWESPLSANLFCTKKIRLSDHTSPLLWRIEIDNVERMTMNLRFIFYFAVNVQRMGPEPPSYALLCVLYAFQVDWESGSSIQMSPGMAICIILALSQPCT